MLQGILAGTLTFHLNTKFGSLTLNKIWVCRSAVGWIKSLGDHCFKAIGAEDIVQWNQRIRMILFGEGVGGFK